LTKFSTSEVEKFQEQAKEIDDLKAAGHFVNKLGEPLPGSDEVFELLYKLVHWIKIVLER
jgi:hypothetical protein